MNVDYSAYEGFKVKGETKTVLSRGEIVIDEGNYVGRAGDGAFVNARPYGGQYANTHANMVRDVLAPRASLGSPGRRILSRHCESPSDEAIQTSRHRLDMLRAACEADRTGRLSARFSI